MKSVKKAIDNILRGVIDEVYKNEVPYFILMNKSHMRVNTYKNQIWDSLWRRV